MRISAIARILRRSRANPEAKALGGTPVPGDGRPESGDGGSGPGDGSPDCGEVEADRPDGRAMERLRGTLQLRHVDAGSCNGCEIEIGSIFSPAYDAEQFGIGLEASPRHADGLIVTGPVTRNMAGPLRTTYEALPRPRIVVAIGDCARDCGAFRGGYGVEGAVGDVIPVDVTVSGCPPEPAAILDALRSITRR